MVTESTFEPFAAAPADAPAEDEAALAAAYAQAVAELNRIRDKASVDDSTTTNTATYSMHEVAGIGKYVIPRRTGWKALIDVIHDPVPNIDFSANIYPAFDGIVGDHFQSPHFLDPLDDKYEARSYLSLHPGRRPYEDLRDNVAAVRNFLMQAYYADTPEGMTPEKAQKALAEIAGFVGDGLYNNWLFLNVVPNHKAGEPFISLTRAQAPHGEGAQYIYEKILEHQRHSNWMRPFAAVAALFGHKNTQPDWKLPPASETHFTDYHGKDMVTEGAPPAGIDAESIAVAAANVAAIEARLTNLRDSRALTNTAIDLDALGNHLLYTAQNMQGVAHISEPVRRDAVAIARDILNKLKISIGDLHVIDGLKMKPSDDMAVLGAVKGVAMVYERLLAWARGNNDAAIFQHPSVLAATQAIGQLGYLAKLEARRMALMAGNSSMANGITEQLQRLPAAFTTLSDSRFGSLLDKVEQGIDTVINRIQEVSVSGAKIGKSVDNRGTSMDAPPTAGSANQVGADEAARRNAEMLTAQQLAAMANTARAQRSSQQAQPTQSQTAPARPGSVQGRPQAAQAARTQRQSSSTAPAGIGQNLMNDAQRKAANFAASQAAHHHEEERHHHEELLRQQQVVLQAQQKAKAAALAKTAAKIDPNMLKGFKSGMSMTGVTGAPIMAGRAIDPKNVMKPQIKPMAAAPAPTPPKSPNAPQTTTLSATDDPTKQPYMVQPPTPPQGRGR